MELDFFIFYCGLAVSGGLKEPFEFSTQVSFSLIPGADLEVSRIN